MKNIITLFLGIIIINVVAQVDDTNNKIEEALNQEFSNLGLDNLVNMEITVASKKAEKVSDAPGMITVYSQQDIDRYGYYNLADLASVTSGYGLSPHAFGERGFETRGQASSAFENDKHLILIDGIPVNFARSYKAPIDNELPIYFSKRVEFLKGPGSALYGVSAFYGVVNLVSDELEENGMSVGLKFSLGNHDFNRRIMANTLIKNDQGQTKINIGYYSKDPSHEKIVNSSFMDWDEQHSVFMNFSHQLTTGVLNGFTVGAIYMYRRTGLGVSWDSKQSTALNDQNWGTFIPYIKYNRQLNTKFSVHSYGKINISDDKGNFLIFDDKQTNDTLQQVASEYFRRTQNFEFLLEGKYKVNQKINIIAGINYDIRAAKADQTSYDNKIYTNDTATARLIDEFTWYNEKDNVQTFSTYTQLQYKLDVLAGLILTGGLRYDYGLINGNISSERADFGQFSPRLGLVQKLTEQISLKVLYGRALRGPTLKSVGLNNEAKESLEKNGIDPTLIKDVKEESIGSYEIGISYHHRKIGGSIAGFYNITNNSLEKISQSFDELSGAENIYTNVDGKFKGKGLEIDVYVLPIKGLKIAANYSFAQASAFYKSDNDEQIEEEISFMPTHKTNFFVNYTLPIKYKMSITAINRNVAGFRGENHYEINQKPYSLLDINMVFPLSKYVNIEGQVRNLLNTKYEISGNQGSGAYVQQPGTNFLLTLSIQY